LPQAGQAGRGIFPGVEPTVNSDGELTVATDRTPSFPGNLSSAKAGERESILDARFRGHDDVRVIPPATRGIPGTTRGAQPIASRPRFCYKTRPMPTKKPSKSKKDYIHYHKDGSIWAKGKMVGGKMDGYWEWFRKDGTKLRSGHFEKGKQVGEWTTYDKQGKVYKVTRMK
jgi:hypothetical protein